MNMYAFKVFLKTFTLSYCVTFTLYTITVWAVNGFNKINDPKIYPNGSNAVYLGVDNKCIINRKDGSFEACYIDMLSSPQEKFEACSSSWTEKDDRDPQEDFNYCLQMHKELNGAHK